jgi:hypothetical protein
MLKRRGDTSKRSMPSIRPADFSEAIGKVNKFPIAAENLKWILLICRYAGYMTAQT